jgi:hypothetical protein
VSLLFDALMLTGNIQTNGTPILISGANQGDGLSIRHLSELIPPLIPAGVDYQELTALMLKEAFALMNARRKVERGAQWDRLQRLFYIWAKALRERNTHERLHQFCRCIEGLVLADAGSTTSQFVSRTELFVGPRHHDTMRALYQMRSKTEHMHDYDFPAGMPERQKRLEVMRFTALAQNIATACLARLLRTPKVWTYYSDKDQQAAFWKLGSTDRTALWGPPMDLTALDRAFDPTVFTDESLGVL